MTLKELQLKFLVENLRRDDGQISHGLNLVLKLKCASDMGELLARIQIAERRIHAGLGELNFVHFARFLPAYDNSALLVITDFDGPLAPYVLDFAIEIGKEFDMLLSYTQGTEHIVPVKENPAEFLAFVKKNNTVTVPPYPPGTPPQAILDWPLYSAYPDESALEILGARSDLPIPKADRWITPVERADVQGNVLRGYRAERVRHFMLGVVDPGKAREWLADKATPDAGAPPGVLKVTSFEPWRAGTKPNLMFNIGLTYRGMKALGIREPWLAPFPEAFVQGAVERAKDNFDIGGNAPDHWWLGGPQQPDIHVIVSLYHAPGAKPDFDKAVKALTDSLPAGGLRLLQEQEAFYNNGASWFGYADGITNPRIATACPVPEDQRDLQPASTAGEFVLGAKYNNIYGGTSLGALPEALATNGTFCAIRVLKQDTKAFDDTVEREAARLNVKPDWLAAKLMGRWYKGAPLSLHPDTEPMSHAEWGRNDFDYAPSYEYPDTPMDHVGARCPVGAHIRRANPRTARVAGARYARRLMRRGMHYQTTDAHGEREVGLFGMFICADLERQFEFIQREWINGDTFAAGLRGTRDPVVGTPLGDKDVFSIPMPNAPPLEARLPQFVFTKGSVYMFMPGLDALRHLDRFATEDPPAPAPKVIPPVPENEGDVMIDGPSESSAALNPFGGLTPSVLLEIAQASVGTFGKVDNRVGSLRNLRFDPRRRDFQIDPYPVYASFRAREPVHYSPLYGGWFVFGYDDVVRVCTEDDNFSAAAPDNTDPRGLFTLDVPEHTAVRRVVADAWDWAAVDTDKFVKRSIDRTLAAISARGPCFDLVDDFARPVPRDVYFDILGAKGISVSDRLELDALARTVMKFHDHTLSRLQQWDGILAGFELGERIKLMLASSLLPGSSYAGSFLMYLAQAVVSGRLDPIVAVVTVVNLTVAGFMSVEFLLATGIRRLLLDKTVGWNAVKGDPSTVPLFLREMRRTEHALSVIDRFAKKDIDIGGVRIPEGKPVFGVLASANRDHRIYGPDADKFNPYRAFPAPPKPAHLGLGWGTHECMGRSLEKSITEPTIRRLTAEMPGLRLQSAAQPPWFENFYFRSFDHLAVTLK